MKKKIMIKTENGITSLRVYIQNPNGEFVSMSGGLNNLVSENIENVNKDNFVRLDLTKNTVSDFISNLLYPENIDNILEVWYDRSLLNKPLTVAYPNGLLYKIEIKEKHVLQNTDKTFDIENVIHTLKDVLNNDCTRLANGCLVGKFNYNVTDVVYKKGIDPVLHKHMEDALDDLIGNVLAYSIPFNSELEYVLVIVDDMHYLFDFDSELNFKKKLYKKISNCFSNGERIRVYHITLDSTTDVLNLLNLDTGNAVYFDIDNIKNEVDGKCECGECSKDTSYTEEHVEPVNKDDNDTVANKPYALCLSNNEVMFFNTYKDLKNYCRITGNKLFRINQNVTPGVKKLLNINYGFIKNAYGITEKVNFFYTNKYFISGPQQITSKIRFKQINTDV